MSTKQICWTVWRELCLGETGLKFGAQNLKKNIYGRMDYRKKLDGNINVQKKINSAFSKGSLSFLCTSSNEKNSEKLKKAECEQKYKLNINEYRKLTAEKWKTMDASSKEKLVAERGITLLTLIITVVIMIILAAVTINVTLGEGGLVDQAKWAAEQTANSTQSEQGQLENVASQINDIIAGIGSGGSDTNSTGGEDTNSVETNSVDTNSVEETNTIDTNSVGETNTVDTNTIDPEPDPLPDGTITIGEPQWQDDGTANVTVETTEPDVTIEYQIGGTDEGRWIPVEGGTIEGIKNGEIVYVRITDGEQASNPQNKKIEDATAPEKANIEVNPTSVLVGESLTATVTHVDSGIGVDVGNSKWVLTESADPIGTSSDVLSQYMEKFTANSETITLNSNTAGTYYLHVLTVDKAGNKTETVSSAITISAITGTVSKSGDVSWNTGKATLVLQSSETSGNQLKIVYKINGEGEWQDYNGTSITGLNHGDKVTACLTNASQTTFGPETSFEIKDEIAPTVTVTAQGSPTTNSITVTALASDNESGMVANPTYTFQYKTSGAGSYNTPDGAENISNSQYTFTGLTQGTTYDIQVIVNGDVAGNSGTGTLTNQTTATVPGASEGLVTGNITASPASWDNYKASTTLTTTTNFKIQYQVNGTAEGSWSEAANSPVTVSNLNHGDTVYARLTDGTNAGNYAAINIIDGIDPTVSVTVNEVTDSTIAVTVTATDKESGLASSNAYKYYLNSESSPRGTSSSNTYTYENLTGSTSYTIKVEVVDKGNNAGTGTTQATTEKGYATNVNELEAGDYVYYTDGQGTRQLCAVLYDSSSPYGVEIITMNTVEDVEIGEENPDTVTTQAVNEYNNAISTLNNATNKYINTSYADAARSVGSVPGNPSQDNAGYYTRNDSWFSTYNGKFKNKDNNHETDYNQMSTLGIQTIDNNYWFASRYMYTDTKYNNFGVNCMSNKGYALYNQLARVAKSGITFSHSVTDGLRPVFHLRDNIKVTGGTGEESSPYTLGT